MLFQYVFDILFIIYIYICWFRSLTYWFTRIEWALAWHTHTHTPRTHTSCTCIRCVSRIRNDASSSVLFIDIFAPWTHTFHGIGSSSTARTEFGCCFFFIYVHLSLSSFPNSNFVNSVWLQCSFGRPLTVCLNTITLTHCYCVIMMAVNSRYIFPSGNISCSRKSIPKLRLAKLLQHTVSQHGLVQHLYHTVATPKCLMAFWW